MAKKEKEIPCTVEFTEGAEQRIMAGMVDLYYGIKDGVYEGPPLLGGYTQEKPA